MELLNLPKSSGRTQDSKCFFLVGFPSSPVVFLQQNQGDEAEEIINKRTDARCGLVGMVMMVRWLALMILELFSNHNGCVILWLKPNCLVLSLAHVRTKRLSPRPPWANHIESETVQIGMAGKKGDESAVILPTCTQEPCLVLLTDSCRTDDASDDDSPKIYCERPENCR